MNGETLDCFEAFNRKVVLIIPHASPSGLPTERIHRQTAETITNLLFGLTHAAARPWGLQMHSIDGGTYSHKIDMDEAIAVTWKVYQDHVIRGDNGAVVSMRSRTPCSDTAYWNGVCQYLRTIARQSTAWDYSVESVYSIINGNTWSYGNEYMPPFSLSFWGNSINAVPRQRLANIADEVDASARSFKDSRDAGIELSKAFRDPR